MESIILQALLTNFIYFIAILNLSRLHFPLYKFLLMFIVSAMCMSFSDPSLGGFSNLVVICCAVFFLFLQTKDFLLSFCYSLFSMAILFVANIVSAVVFFTVFGNASVKDMENPLHMCLLYGVIAVVSYAISKILGILISEKIKNLFAQHDRKYLIYLLFGFLIVMLCFYYQFFFNDYLTRNPILNAAIGVAITVAYLVFLLIAVYVFVTGVKKSIETAHKQELLVQLQDYTTNLESINSDMRRFRHDYMNIIAALFGYIETKDLEGLEQYFTNSIVPIAKRIESTNSTLDMLKNIQTLEVKGLVALKLMHCQERGASVHIEVPSEIDSFNFDIINLTRIIGIFIDNALEACLETQSKVLKFAVLDEKTVKIIIIANAFNEPLPPISEIYKDGFSTKGEQHGMGLFTVRQIADQSDSAILNTYVENDLFVQQLKLLDNLTDGE